MVSDRQQKTLFLGQLWQRFGTKWAPKDHFSLCCDFNQLKAELFSLLAEPLLHALVVLDLLLGKDGLVIGLSGG